MVLYLLGKQKLQLLRAMKDVLSASYRTFVPTVMLSRSEASLPLSNERSFAAAAASLRMTNPEHTCDCLYLGHAAGLRSGSRWLQPGGCRSAHHIKAGQPAPTS